MLIKVSSQKSSGSNARSHFAAALLASLSLFCGEYETGAEEIKISTAAKALKI